MDTSRIQRVFLQAVTLVDGNARIELLDRECEGDSQIRERVDALLKAHANPEPLLDQPLLPNVTALLSTTELQRELLGDDPFADTHASDAADSVAETLASLPFLEPPTRADSLGRLAHFELLELLGTGGFGVVFKAFDEKLQRIVAIKILATQMAATSPARKRFPREAWSAAAVRHENVVQIYAVEEQPSPYIVVEYIPGQSLQQKLAGTGPLNRTRSTTDGGWSAAREPVWSVRHVRQCLRVLR